MTYVDTATAQWTEVEPGYRRMTLVNDRESGTRIVLLQYDAGYQLSYLDEHEHDEYLYVLSGTFVDQPGFWAGNVHPQPARVVASAQLARRLHLPRRVA